MALKLESVDFKPLTKKLEDFDVTVTVRRAPAAASISY